MFEGYVRQPYMSNKLATLIEFALKNEPKLRLGQLISLAIRDKDLFSLYDEDLYQLVHEFIERGDE